MLNITSIEKALEKYSDTQNPGLLDSLTVFGALLKKAAHIAEQQQCALPQYSQEALEEAVRGKATLLSHGDVAIDAQAFQKALIEMSEVFQQAAQLDDEALQLCQQVDWSDYATPSLLQVAARDPMQYLQTIEAISPDEDLLDIYVLPIVGFTLRAFLDSVATEASQKIDALYPDTVHIQRPLTCPVCGSSAAVAAVVGTPRNGNVKKLYCTCCGAQWKFERIRCAVCGDDAVSDLEYVHDEQDQAHRLHVCKGCSSAMPTVFTAETLGFNADIESIVMSDLEAFFMQNQAHAQQD